MRLLLKIENTALLALSLYMYFFTYQFSWKVLIIFLLVPDFSMLGYLFGNQIGAFTYNVIHSVPLPIALYIVGESMKSELLIMIALILFIHIFMDRTIGYGLKYFDSFKHTHLD